jgi:Tfp pilus assembly protein PilN
MSKADTTQLGAPSLPQVNLLPPEIAAARNLTRIKVWLGVALLMTVVLAAAGFGAALLNGNAATAELETAQSDGARLQGDQAKFAEVPKVLGALADAKAARLVGMSTEVAWTAYLNAISATLPPNVSIDNLSVHGGTPMVPALAPATALQAPSLCTITFAARSMTIPDSAAWADALNSVPGFADAWVSSASVTAQGTTTYYQVVGSVQVNNVALANRFEPTKGAS